MKKAVIIGAGPAGLTAAYELHKADPDCDITILEQSGQVGGLSKTICYKGNRLDIGGHRFFSKSDRVMNWWMNFFSVEEHPDDVQVHYHGQKRVLTGLPFHKNGSSVNDIFLIRRRSSRILFNKQLFDYPIKFNFKNFKKFGWKLSLRVLFSYLHQRLSFLPPKMKTLEDFMIRRFGKVMYRKFFKSYTEKVWGQPCSEISYEWGAQRIKGVSLRKMVKNYFIGLFKSEPDLWQKNTETSLIEYFLYPKFGPGHMWERVAEELIASGVKIKMQEKVSHITQQKDVINYLATTHTVTGMKSEYDADVVFSSMAISDWAHTMNGQLKPEVHALATGLDYRAFITVGVLCRKLTLKEIEKDTWLYIQEPHVKIGRLQIFNNWSPSLVADPDTIWLGAEYFCLAHDAFWKLSDEQIGEQAIAELQQLGIITTEDVLEKTVVREEKAYPGYFGVYNEFTVIKDYLDTITNLYPIGRNGMHKYNNQDHSMLTAMEAVDLYTKGQKNKSSLWAINTEESYHETK